MHSHFVEYTKSIFHSLWEMIMEFTALLSILGSIFIQNAPALIWVGITFAATQIAAYIAFSKVAKERDSLMESHHPLPEQTQRGQDLLLRHVGLLAPDGHAPASGGLDQRLYFADDV